MISKFSEFFHELLRRNGIFNASLEVTAQLQFRQFVAEIYRNILIAVHSAGVQAEKLGTDTGNAQHALCEDLYKQIEGKMIKALGGTKREKGK